MKTREFQSLRKAVGRRIRASGHDVGVIVGDLNPGDKYAFDLFFVRHRTWMIWLGHPTKAAIRATRYWWRVTGAGSVPVFAYIDGKRLVFESIHGLRMELPHAPLEPDAYPDRVARPPSSASSAASTHASQPIRFPRIAAA